MTPHTSATTKRTSETGLKQLLPVLVPLLTALAQLLKQLLPVLALVRATALLRSCREYSPYLQFSSSFTFYLISKFN